MAFAPHDDAPPIEFVSLGMFIIDEIHPPPSSSASPHLDIIGGAGTFSALGARLLSPAPRSSASIGWIVDAGTDFPDSIRTTLLSWQTSINLRARDGLTTRGWNGYTTPEHREFRYLTPKTRLTAADLDARLLHSRAFHLICSATRCIELVEAIRARRQEIPSPYGLSGGDHDPIFVWEPVPDLCVPAELPMTRQALQHVHVLSPNHEELGALFGFMHPASGIDRAVLEAQVRSLFLSTDHALKGIVVRAGSEGCFVASSSADPPVWVPPYHRSGAGAKVLDPTGGGNGFLGGLTVGLVRTDFNLRTAAIWGSVAAAFCIEQVGVPTLQIDEAGKERWNGEDPFDRVREMERQVETGRGSVGAMGPNML